MAALLKYFRKVEGRIPAAWAAVLERGAVINGAQTVAAGGTLTVFAGHGFAASDKALYALARDNISMKPVETITGTAATTLTLTVGGTFPDGALMINLGQDTGGVLQTDGSYSRPNWDAAAVTIHGVPDDTGAALANSLAPIIPGNEIAFYGSGEIVWVVVLDSAYNPSRLYTDLTGETTGTDLSTADIADPTGTIGLTVDNGTAETIMRSDAAPPLDQGIEPTWTEPHTHTPASAGDEAQIVEPSSVPTVSLVKWKDAEGNVRFAYAKDGNIGVNTETPSALLSVQNQLISDPSAALGAEMWFKADSLTDDNVDPGDAPLSNGDELQSWDDSSGNGYGASGGFTAQDPTYVANWQNSLPGVDFDQNEAFSLAKEFGEFGDVTLFAVIGLTADSGVVTFLAGDNTVSDSTPPDETRPRGIQIDAGSNNFYWANVGAEPNDTVTFGDHSAYTPTNVLLYCLYRSGTTWYARVNGTAVGSASAANADFVTNFDRINASTGFPTIPSTQDWTCGELIGFNRLLNLAEIGQIEAYLDDKWAITADPVGPPLQDWKDAAGNELSKIDNTGDIDALGGYRQSIDGWYIDNVANGGDHSADVMSRDASAFGDKWVATREGSITGVSVKSNEARSGGTLTVEVYVGGSQTGLTAVIDGSNTTFKATTQDKGLDTFSAGDEIDIRITTSSWAPTTADVRAQLELET